MSVSPEIDDISCAILPTIYVTKFRRMVVKDSKSVNIFSLSDIDTW